MSIFLSIALGISAVIALIMAIKRRSNTLKIINKNADAKEIKLHARGGDKCSCKLYYSDSAIRERCIQYYIELAKLSIVFPDIPEAADGFFEYIKQGGAILRDKPQE